MIVYFFGFLNPLLYNFLKGRDSFLKMLSFCLCILLCCWLLFCLLSYTVLSGSTQHTMVPCTALDFCSACSMVGEVLRVLLLHLQVVSLNHLQDGAFKFSWRRMCKTCSLWRRSQLNSRCFEHPCCSFLAVPRTREAPYSAVASCRQCSSWYVAASISLPASWFIFHCIFTAIFIISINITKEKVVIDHDKAVKAVGKCIQYCLLLNRKWVVIFYLNYSDTCSLWLWKRQFNII